MTAPTFSQIESGYEFPAVKQSYVQSAIDYYALASLDMNPVHTNGEWAARAKVFGIPETVGHGMMTMSTLANHWWWIHSPIKSPRLSDPTLRGTAV